MKDQRRFCYLCGCELIRLNTQLDFTMKWRCPMTYDNAFCGSRYKETYDLTGDGVELAKLEHVDGPFTDEPEEDYDE